MKALYLCLFLFKSYICGKKYRFFNFIIILLSCKTFLTAITNKLFKG